MKNFMRIIATALVLLLAAACFAGCKHKGEKPENTAAPVSTDNGEQGQQGGDQGQQGGDATAVPTDEAGNTVEPGATEDAGADPTEPGDDDDTGEGDGQGGITDGGDIEIDVPEGEGSGGL